MRSSARAGIGCVMLMCSLLSVGGCSSPGCIRNSDCPVNQDCVASDCQLPAAGSSAAGSSGKTAVAAGASGTIANTGGAGGTPGIDAGVITDAGLEAQAP
jgi:hypothetical protein